MKAKVWQKHLAILFILVSKFLFYWPALLIAVATCSNAASNEPINPEGLTAVVTNTAIATAIRPYSIAVTPLSSLLNFDRKASVFAYSLVIIFHSCKTIL